MATELVTESTAQKLTQRFEAPLTDLSGRIQELAKLPLTLTTVQLVKEWDGEAQRYLKELETSELADHIKGAFKLHRFLTTALKRFTGPIELGRQIAAQKFASWERKRREEAEAERRKREAEAKAEQERLRLEEAAHLEQLGHKQEAEQLLDSPLPPVSMPEEPAPAGKLDGIAVTTTWNWDGLSDPKAFFHFIAENPAYQGLMVPSLGAWKKLLTANHGQLQIPGLRVATLSETRHRGDA